MKVICRSAGEHKICEGCGASEPHDPAYCEPCPVDENAICNPVVCDAEAIEPPPFPPGTDGQKVQDRENRENELWSLEQQQKSDECPRCNGYGEVYDETDYEQPHKDCSRCLGSGQWYN